MSQQVGMVPAIFCINAQGSDLISDDVKIYKSQYTKKYNFNIFRALCEAIEDFRPHVLHAWLPASMTIPAMLLSRKHDIPCVFSYRNAMFFRRPLAILEYLCGLLCATRVISNNPIAESNWFYSLLYRIKHGVEIKNAVDVNVQRKKPLEPSFISKENSILFAGRITQQKNWSCLLRAFPMIASRHKVELIICGQGEETPLLMQEIQRQGIQEYVHILGYREDLHEIMMQSTMFVLPSWYEGMANVFLEALAVGLPCIVSDIAANREIIGTSNCALTFDPILPNELAERVIWLLDHEARIPQLVKEGWMVADSFSPKRLVTEHKDVYKALCSNNSA